MALGLSLAEGGDGLISWELSLLSLKCFTLFFIEMMNLKKKPHSLLFDIEVLFYRIPEL